MNHCRLLIGFFKGMTVIWKNVASSIASMCVFLGFSDINICTDLGIVVMFVKLKKLLQFIIFVSQSLRSWMDKIITENFREKTQKRTRNRCIFLASYNNISPLLLIHTLSHIRMLKMIFIIHALIRDVGIGVKIHNEKWNKLVYILIEIYILVIESLNNLR